MAVNNHSLQKQKMKTYQTEKDTKLKTKEFWQLRYSEHLLLRNFLCKTHMILGISAI